MLISELTIKQLRNLKPSTLHFSPGYNIIYGNNGAGKTSLLEAIYYLSLSRSFRASTHSRIIQNGQDSLYIIGEIDNKTSPPLKIGISRHTNGQKDMRINGKRTTKVAMLAQALPVQLINHQQQALLNTPKARRHYLDWGLFHVEHNFFSTWQSYQAALKQRNAGLRQGLSLKQLAPWDALLTKEAQALDNMRQSYMEMLKKAFTPLWQSLMPEEINLSLGYHRGWPANKDLQDILADNLTSDARLGYTRSGAHRADIQLYVEKAQAKDYLSQGQQKLLIYALKLAQGNILKETTQTCCIYLIDDLPAELDASKRKQIADTLNALQAQVFLTGVSLNDLSDFCKQEKTRMFHVEHGNISLQKELATHCG